MTDMRSSFFVSLYKKKARPLGRAWCLSWEYNLTSQRTEHKEYNGEQKKLFSNLYSNSQFRFRFPIGFSSFLEGCKHTKSSAYMYGIRVSPDPLLLRYLEVKSEKNWKNQNKSYCFSMVFGFVSLRIP